MTTPALLNITDGVAKITLNCPKKGNALDQPMIALLNGTTAGIGPEGGEGINAFPAKRKTNFQGSV